MPYREVTDRDWWRVGVYTLLVVTALVVTAVILIPVAWPFGLVVWLALVSGGLFLLARWHASNTAYRCPACGHEFEISVYTDFVSLQVPDKKYLRCPQCGERNWTTVLMKTG